MGSAILDHPFRTHFAHLVRWLQCMGDAPISPWLAEVFQKNNDKQTEI